jgi:lysophospholipase L1-like esterase
MIDVLKPIRVALVAALSAALLTCNIPSGSAAAARCAAQGLGTTSPLSAVVTANADATTIPGGVTIASAPSNKISALGGAALAPDGADAETYMFNWKYPPHGQGPTSSPNPRGWGVQLTVAGTANIEFQVYARRNAAWTITVDGHPSSDVPQTDSALAEGTNLIRFALPNAGEHAIRFQMNNLSLGKIFADPGSNAEPWPVSGPRVFFLGDSLTQGGPQSTGGELGSWIWKFSGQCGFDDVWDGGIGGTGSIATGTDGLWADYATRVATDVAPAEPDIVFITSYYGDRNSSPADIAAAFTRAVEDARALPSRPSVIVTGTYDPLGVNNAPYRDIDAALLAACTALGVPYIEPRTGNVYDGSGKVLVPAGEGGPWITPANREMFIGADGVHQTDAGQAYMADRMYNSYRALT